MKYEVHRVQYEEMSDDLLASARDVVGRAQVSVALAATNMFWTRLNMYSPIGAIILLVVWWFVTPHLPRLAWGLDQLSLVAFTLLVEWIVLYVLARKGFADFVANTKANPYCHARQIFGLGGDPRSALFVVKSPAGAILGASLLLCGKDTVEWKGEVPASLLGRHRDAAVIRYVGVDPEFQGFGLGSAMMRAILEHAKANGVEKILLRTETFMSAARKMYEGLGFVLVRRIPVARPVGYAHLVYQMSL